MIKEIVTNINEMSASLKRITTGNEDKVNQIIDDVKAISEQLAFESDRFQKDSFASDLSKVGPILDKVDSAMSDLKIIMADMKDGKGTVGKLLRDDAVVDQVSQTLSSVNRLVNRINNVEADIGLSTGANTRIGSDTRFDMDIYPAPERFFRLGVVTNEFGPQTEKETVTYTSVNDGNETKVYKRKENTSDFKFNLQIGRRIQRFALRAGIIESTGGVGADYFFPDWGIRTGTEVFDYQKDAGPNLRVFSEIKLWNVLFTRIAGEDLISKDGQQSATFSLGLRFNDQDLAAVLGLLAVIMDKNWLIRTKSNHILGPITKEKLIELFNNESLKPDDEICSGNGFWFFIREEEMVNRYLLGDEKQTFNPISEAKNVLTTDTVQVEQELSQDENTLVSNLNSMLNSTDEAPTAESKVESAPAKEADVLPLKKKTESKKIDNKITPQKL